MSALNAILSGNEKTDRKLLIRFLLDMIVNRTGYMFNAASKGEKGYENGKLVR